jgi:hypothetical protein
MGGTLNRRKIRNTILSTFQLAYIMERNSIWDSHEFESQSSSVWLSLHERMRLWKSLQLDPSRSYLRNRLEWRNEFWFCTDAVKSIGISIHYLEMKTRPDSWLLVIAIIYVTLTLCWRLVPTKLGINSLGRFCGLLVRDEAWITQT